MGARGGVAAALLLAVCAAAVALLRLGGDEARGEAASPAGGASAEARHRSDSGDLGDPGERPQLALRAVPPPGSIDGSPAEETRAVPAGAPAPPDAARHAVALGLRGRVATAGGEGVGGVAVALRFAGKDRWVAHTGPDGGFAFPADAFDAYGALVAEKLGWRIEPARMRLRDLALDAEVAFTAEELALFPLRARLVDRATGEPVPRLGVRFEGEPGVDAAVESDDAGRIALEPHLAAGSVDVTLLGGSYRTADRSLAWPPQDGAEEVVLQIDVGPTYDLALEGAGGLDDAGLADLRALLVPAPHPAARAVARAREQGAPLPEDWSDALSGADEHAESAALRPDGPRHGGPWVRFDVPLEDGAAPRRVANGFELLIEGAGLAGRAAVPNLIGIAPHVVRVELAPAGGVAGRVGYPPRTFVDPAVGPTPDSGIRVWSRSESGPARAWVTLRGVTGDVGSAATDSDGAFAFRGVAPGEYELLAESARAGSARAAVTVRAGAAAEVDVTLPIHPEAVFALGVLRSRTGAYAGRAVVELVSPSDPARHFRVDAPLVERSWFRPLPSETDVIAGVFALRGIPAGSYDLRVRSPDGFAWTPAAVRLDGPRHDLVFTCEDAVDTAEIAFDLRDAASGEEVSGDGFAWLEGGLPDDDVRRVPRTASGRWIAVAHHCVPTAGRWAAAPDEDRVLVRAELEPGPGMIVLVATPWGEPLGGAQVLVDGASQGLTDVDGWLRIPGVLAQRSVGARLPGWVEAPNAAGLPGVMDLGMALVTLVRE